MRIFAKNFDNRSTRTLMHNLLIFTPPYKTDRCLCRGKISVFCSKNILLAPRNGMQRGCFVTICSSFLHPYGKTEAC